MKTFSQYLFEARDANARRVLARRFLKKDVTEPPKFDPEKSILYNRILRLDFEFTKDFKVDTHKKFNHPDSKSERYESVAAILNRTPKEVANAVELGIDPYK